MLLLEQSFETHGPKGNLVAFAFKFKGVTGAEVKFVAQAFGNSHSSGLVKS